MFNDTTAERHQRTEDANGLFLHYQRGVTSMAGVRGGSHVWLEGEGQLCVAGVRGGSCGWLE